MKFLIIIPVHNEEEYLPLCLNSLKGQSFQDFECVVVDDGSTDSTRKIIEQFAEHNSRFELKVLDKSEHQPGAKVVNAFNEGLKVKDLDKFDVICKFDADIIFPKNYLLEINDVYQKNPKVGMVSGLVFIEKNGEWSYENISSKNHIRGPIKSYKKECFIAMGELKPVLGWDNIDVFLAKKNGYEIITIKDLWVKHLRSTAYKYKNQRAEKLGEYFYNIGLNFPLAMLSSLKSAYKNKSFSEFFITMKFFLKLNKKHFLTDEEIRFIRQLRWKEIFEKLK